MNLSSVRYAQCESHSVQATFALFIFLAEVNVRRCGIPVYPTNGNFGQRSNQLGPIGFRTDYVKLKTNDIHEAAQSKGNTRNASLPGSPDQTNGKGLGRSERSVP